MGDNRFIRQLHRELPGLVESEVLSTDTAAALRSHYGLPEKGRGTVIMTAVFGVLGATLIGSGIILLLAHNWEQLGRPARTVLSFLPLLAAQGVAGWVVTTGRRGLAWREGAGTFLFLSIGACVALIGQTYHIPGDLGRYLLTWAVLGLPVVYLLEAALPAVLVLGGFSWWHGLEVFGGTPAGWYWALTALLVPFFWREVKENRGSARVSMALWTVPAALFVPTVLTAARGYGFLVVAAIGGMAGAVYLAGRLTAPEEAPIWQRPFTVLGSLGLATLSLTLTYRDLWQFLGRGPHGEWETAMVVIVAWTLCWAGLAVHRVTKSHRGDLLLGAVPLLAWAGLGLLHLTGAPWAPAAVFNAYVVAAGCAVVTLGARRGRLGTVNLGMLWIAGLLLCRFVDTDLSFVSRGVAFIAVGTTFLAVNARMLRARRRTTP